MRANTKAEPASPGKLLTIKGAAHEMSISQSQLYVLIKAGEIKSIPVGTHGRRVPMSEIDAYIERKLAEETGPATDAA